MMKDLIVGRITSVLDTRRIEVEILQVVRKYHNEYGRKEKVLVKELKTNMLGALQRVSPHFFLHPRLEGSGVMCLVERRRLRGQIEAHVYILERSIREEVEVAS
ncbi:MAG: hypothetical protein OEM19_00825 [Deltaproteobacteria bacterium]|nr:hypothetical protein [Deltaproteobacteria bacterium]